jgi:PPK2 family polyphosphate:nucleotide phosphotransferase
MTARRGGRGAVESVLSAVDPDRPPPLADRDASFRGDLPGDGDRRALREATAELLDRAAELQAALQAEAKQALLVVLQARDAGGKDGTVKKVFGALNPVALRVTGFKAPSADDLSHDFLWRIHHAAPARGTVGVFNRSHYEDVLVARVHRIVPASVWERRYDQINEFERMLSENGTTVVKLLLHISRAEQLERLEARIDDPKKGWKVQPGDWADRKRWREFTRAYRDALVKCSTPWAPWYVVPADDKKVRNWLVADLLVATLERMKPKYPKAQPLGVEQRSH